MNKAFCRLVLAEGTETLAVSCKTLNLIQNLVIHVFNIQDSQYLNNKKGFKEVI